MIYYNDGIVLIRELREADAEYFAAEECAQGWESSPERYQIRLKDSAEADVSLSLLNMTAPPQEISISILRRQADLSGTKAIP